MPPLLNIPESTIWEENIYLLQPGDRAAGGLEGVSNRQARQLTNRTRYLKKEVDDLQIEFDEYEPPLATEEAPGTVLLAPSLTTQPAVDQEHMVAKQSAVFELNGKITGFKKITIASTPPSGGDNGDLWVQY